MLGSGDPSICVQSHWHAARAAERDTKGELQVYAQAIAADCLFNVPRCPRFDQCWALHGTLSLAAGARRMSNLPPKKRRRRVGDARQPLTLPSGGWKSQATRFAEQASCQSRGLSRCRGRVGPSAAGAAAPRGPHPRPQLCGRPKSGSGSLRHPLAQRGSSALSRECLHRAGVVRCGTCVPYLAP